MKKEWGIIGLGWLGLELARALQLAGASCWGTRRQDFDWTTDVFPQKNCDILFLNTPPLTSMTPQQFVEKIPVFKNRKVIFISSISVYGSQTGVVTESTAPLPESTGAHWLFAVEQLLQKKFPNVLIIRPGGLIGGARHPIFQLSKKGQVADASAPINLIHRQDLVRIIIALAQLESPPSVVNAVAPTHPSKEQYYSSWIIRQGLAPIDFVGGGHTGKIVRSEFLSSFYTEWVCPDLDSL